MIKQEIIRKKSPLSHIRMFSLLANYCIGYMYVYPMIVFYGSSLLYPDSNMVLPELEFMIYVFMILFSVLVGWPLLKEEYYLYKEEKGSFFPKLCICLKNLLYIYVGNLILGGIVQWLSKTEASANQESIAEAANVTPLLIIFTTLIFAPIVEEIVFRGVIYRFLRSRFNFMKASIISSLLFGFIHVYLSLFTGDYNDLWYIFVYAIAGFLIAKTYEETHSLYGAIFLHFLNNAIGILFLF
ncbi:MAG: CPBP family intramembrane metalloprotease [Erysipelotrichaceae bacterium]|nr:CPBP family intramembrane metalloprotease [Erysipelotrichaceae bacterium]